jgi:hydrogenase-4 component F
MIVVALLAAPLAGAAALLLARRRPVADLVHGLTTAATAALAAGLALAVARGGVVRGPGLGLAVDGLSALMACLVATVGVVAAVGVPAWLAHELGEGRVGAARAARFRPLFHLFVFTMLAAVTTENVGVMWVAIEGTTLASVFLITTERTRASLEAAYKYLLICSVGIAVAFLGTVLLYAADVTELGGAVEHGLEWPELLAAAPGLPRRTVQLAFALLLVGYGTKAGLAPMHTWLPDAHSEAPAPVSALMSGVLIAVGLYALLRLKPVVDVAAGPAFARGLLLGFGLASMAVAAAFLWAPRNYKRMLAYSSVEHMGLVCVGVAFGGPWGLGGALLHVVNHALAKSSLFLLAGRILQRFGSAEVARVRGLARAMPWTGGAFVAATLALVGVPPFGLFVSELLILRAGFAGGHPVAAGAALALLVVAFGGILRTVNRMAYGVGPAEVPAGERVSWPLAPVAVSLLLLTLIGLGLPPGLLPVIERVAAAAGAGG